ncbi:MAG: hypothetical protein K8F52_00305 [Candidatus Scalindua rubra]|nr:hypothetical protein [Candidatus Scalindua rubra]
MKKDYPFFANFQVIKELFAVGFGWFFAFVYCAKFNKSGYPLDWSNPYILRSCFFYLWNELSYTHTAQD